MANQTIKKPTLSENLTDLERIRITLDNTIKKGYGQEVVKEIIEDYTNILDNVRRAYNDEYPGIINGIRGMK
jgi:hypothetical protein